MSRKVPAARGVAATGVAVVAGAALTGCGASESVPAGDEYAGRVASVAPSPSGDAGYWASDLDESADPAADGISGPYADGDYAATERYGPVLEDSVDVSVTLADGVVSHLEVTGHALLPQSADYQKAFVSEVTGAVVGVPVDQAHVDVLAGASKTTASFNKAIDDIRRQAAEAAD